MSRRVLFGLLLLVAVTSAASAAPFALPTGSKWVTWEAEGASRTGDWAAVRDTGASGGQYLQTDDHAATLQYHFRADRSTTLRLKPLWWRTGQTRSARRYPYPLPQQFGPDTLEAAGDKIYFLAPMGQTLGRFDPAQKTMTGVKLGGYLTDVVYDAARGCVYVSDATQGLIHVVDAATAKERAPWKTAAEPWALALVGGRLYVACRAGKCVQVLDTAQGTVAQTVSLEAEPAGLELASDGKTLTIRFQQQPVQMQTLAPLAPDQVQYNAKPSPLGVKVGTGNKAVSYTADPAKQQVLKAASKVGPAATIDVSAANAGAAAPVPQDLPGYPPAGTGPKVLLAAGDKLFFCATATGQVGVIDTKTDKLIKVLKVGGYPMDLAATPKNEKVYVADAATHTAFVIDTAKLEVTGRIDVPAGPVNLQLVENYNLQRPYMVPGLPINRLFVACYGDKSLAVIDWKTDKLEKTVPLGFRPRYVKLVPSPNPDWWPMMAEDRIPHAMTPKVAVEPAPLTLDLATGQLRAAVDAGEGMKRRNSVKLTVGGVEQTVTGNGNMVLQIATAAAAGAAAPPPCSNVDCSSVCDPRGAQTALAGGDQPGSITVSVDGGPDVDWRSGLWTRPDNQTFLVYGTDEYWEWNAPAFAVKPGEHVLTIKARDDDVELDAVAVEPTAEAQLQVAVRPEPWALHSQVPSGAYQGVFTNSEPVQFTVAVTNPAAEAVPVTVSAALTNYMGEAVPLTGLTPLTVAAGATQSFPLQLAPADTGRFTLTLTARTPEGDVVRDFRFVRLPKLQHPRLMLRPEDLPAMQRRIAAHPLLFKRYCDWLARMTAKEGRFPERFLPNGLTQAELGAAAPPEAKDPNQQYGWRMYELGWRMLGTQFAAQYLPMADKATLEARLKPLLTAPQTNTWVQYHHHGPFFPGAVEGMVDMAPADVRPGLPLTAFMAKYKGDINVYPFTLMSLEEPLSPADRALVYRLAIQHDNFDNYFTAHQGTRGGTWWQNPYSWCYCPTQGLFLSEMYTANFLGESRWTRKPFYRSYLTFMEQADPLSDKSSLLPATRRPSGEPWRWILSAVSQHPLEKDEYGWDEWVRKMDGPLPDETQAVDDLMALKGMPLAGPLEAAPHRFATAVSVPVALALGWYEPAGPTVKRAEQPPTTLMDGDGWARLRSGWTDQDTELWFISGVRDHTTRHQPNTFMVARGGRFLVGTPANWVDDGNCSPSWGNTVVAGDQWLPRWQTNLNAPRSEEKDLIDRFSPVNWSYLARERQLSGYAPAEGGWGGGADLHGHSETLMMDDGRITAYETWPQFDYVAGATTGAWPVDEIRSHERQLVFLKPNVIVVYDRVKLGPNGHPSKWLAAVGPDLAVDGSGFTVGNCEVKLAGQVLLPRDAKVESVEPYNCYQWKKQKLLQISSPGEGNEAEYLVVMTTGGDKLSPAQATATRRREAVEVALKVDGRPYTVRFNRLGQAGGAVVLQQNGKAITHELASGVEDTYRHWSTDRRYRKWVTEPRFDCIVPAGDRAGKSK